MSSSVNSLSQNRHCQPPAVEEPYQPRRRLHREGGPADNQHVGVGYRVYRRVYVGFVERLLVEHYVGLDYPAA